MSNRIKDEVVKSFLEKAVPLIKEKLSPTKILIFGSRVRGDATEDSDIDVILVSEVFREVRFVKRMAMVLKKIPFPKHVDYICYTADEFERVKNASVVVHNAVSEGIAA